MALHPDATAILEHFGAAGIQNLYHFTCIDNLPGIRVAGAVCSKAELERRGAWPPPRPGGNELSHKLDRSLDRWGHLALSLTPRTPMAYHRKQQDHLCFLRIAPRVAATVGVLFTDTNAASYAARSGEGLEGVALINFQAITAAPAPWDRDGWVIPVQAEVLAPGEVSLADIESVAFVSQASLDEGLRLWGPYPHPDFVVDRRVFADRSGTQITYPYLESIAVTDQVITETSDFAAITHQPIVSATSGPATVLISMWGAAGLTVGTLWLPGGKSESETLTTSAMYWYWSSSDLLIPGSASVEVSLRDVRWVTVPFEVVP